MNNKDNRETSGQSIINISEDAKAGKFAHQTSMTEQEGDMSDLEPGDDVMGGATTMIQIKRSGVLVEPT